VAKVTATRFHDFSCGHRVVGHEGACALMHGHNYRVHFTCEAKGLDKVGRVIDFSVIKELLCEWLEDHWDHRFLMYRHDPFLDRISQWSDLGIITVDFNPTAENMGLYLLNTVGPKLLKDHEVKLVSVRVEETRKCQAEVSL